MGFFYSPAVFLTVFLLWYSLAVISNSVVYGSTFTLQSILNVILLRRTLNCDSDLLDGSFDLGHSMAVLLIDAFSIIILNLALPGSSFLAHLSRRLIGELLVYRGIRRPSVVRPSVRRPSSVVRQHFQTTSPLKP